MRNRNFELPEERIRIMAGAPGEMIVRFTYTQDRVEKIRTITGRRWDPDTKCWIVPRKKDTIDGLLSLFGDERLTVDPLLLSLGSTQKEKECPTNCTAVLMRMAQELRLRGYRAKTRKAYLGHSERFFRAVGKESGEIEEEEVREYVHNLLESGASHS